MKYIKSDYWGEYLRLRRMPTTVTEAKNKLICLQETDKRRNPNFERDWFINRKPSKRNQRLVKMYWAFHNNTYSSQKTAIQPRNTAEQPNTHRTETASIRANKRR